MLKRKRIEEIDPSSIQVDDRAEAAAAKQNQKTKTSTSTTTTTTTLDIQHPNVVRFMYDIIEKGRIGTTSRRAEDCIYTFLAGDCFEFKRGYLSPLISNIMETFGCHKLATDTNPNGVGGLTDREYRIMTRITDNPKYAAAQITFFMSCFCLLPSFHRFFVEGNAEKKEAPPPVANRQRLSLFIAQLSKKLDDLTNGRCGSITVGMKTIDPVQVFADSVVGEYVSFCGIPVSQQLILK